MANKIKLIHWTYDPDPFGNMPIYLKMRVNGKTKYKSTGYYIPEKAWDAKNQRVKDSYPLAEDINTSILDTKASALKKIVGDQVRGVESTATQVKQTFDKPRNDIFVFTDGWIETVRNKRAEGTVDNYVKHLNKLELFNGSRQLNFEDITKEFLSRYENWMAETIEGNYIHAIWKTLRTFFNAAILDGVTTHYPFATYENPVYEAPDKDYLTLQELDIFEKYLDTWVLAPIFKEAGIYLLLGCYTGLRVSDWRKFDLKKNISNGRIFLRAQKNGERVTMQVNAPFARNMKRMEYFSYEIAEQTLNEKARMLIAAAGIDKYVSSHTGRHTFAITLCAELGISCETCAELMGITVKTCAENYYVVTNRKIDRETSAAWVELV
jgi:site-specific recombinase XerD